VTDSIVINTLCPKCGSKLVKIHYKSKENWVTNWRIKCMSNLCDVDTGYQCTLSDVYEAFMFLYFNSKSSKHYERKVPEDDSTRCDFDMIEAPWA